MTKLLWMILFFGVYVWLMTSGHDRMVLDYGKSFYKAFTVWFDDADIDYQMNTTKKNPKKRARRWD